MYFIYILLINFIFKINVNVVPSSISETHQQDTPEIRKYRKKFSSDILCAALWGKLKKKNLKINNNYLKLKLIFFLRCQFTNRN